MFYFFFLFISIFSFRNEWHCLLNNRWEFIALEERTAKSHWITLIVSCVFQIFSAFHLFVIVVEENPNSILLFRHQFSFIFRWKIKTYRFYGVKWIFSFVSLHITTSFIQQQQHRKKTNYFFLQSSHNLWHFLRHRDLVVLILTLANNRLIERPTKCYEASSYKFDLFIYLIKLYVSTSKRKSTTTTLFKGSPEAAFY